MNYSFPKNFDLGFAFANKKTTELPKLIKKGINGFHLSPDLPQKNILRKLKRIQKSFGTRFSIHAPFPNPTGLKINLFSKNYSDTKNSKNALFRTIDSASELNCTIIVTHLLNQKQNAIKFDKKQNNLIDFLIETCDYAHTQGIRIAFENSVAKKNSPHNFTGDPKFIRFILNKVSNKNFGVCIDTGHLHISSNALGFNEKSFLQKIASKIICFHFSDNNGIKDYHWLPTKNPTNTRINYEELLKKTTLNNLQRNVLEINHYNYKIDSVIDSARFLESLITANN